MNALRQHIWGRSRAKDRVWSQVVGLAVDCAVRRLLMALNFQAFVDESETPNGEFILAGHVASAESWAKFAVEWEALLPRGTLAKNNKYHFKMSEMALTPERMERVQEFYRVIENHVLLSISCRLNLVDFKRAHESVASLLRETTKINVHFKMWNNPWYMAFRILLDKFHSEREKIREICPLDQKIDFIFDNRSEKASILSVWDEIIANRESKIQEYYGATPRFENDQDFLPLQAADLWAWWVREWYEWENSPVPEKMKNFDFGNWHGKKRSYLAIYVDESNIFNRLHEIAFVHLLDQDVPIQWPQII